MEITLELIERFHEKWQLNQSSGCWEWTGALMGKGYGMIKIPKTRKQIGAHRLSFLIHYGYIPEGMDVCHTCDNPKCVKPSHLFSGTSKENHLDMREKDRHLHGSRNKKAKLNEDKVRQIHKLSDAGLSQGKIAQNFGISQGQVWRILKGIRWNAIYREIYPSKD